MATSSPRPARADKQPPGKEENRAHNLPDLIWGASEYSRCLAEKRARCPSTWLPSSSPPSGTVTREEECGGDSGVQQRDDLDFHRVHPSDSGHLLWSPVTRVPDMSLLSITAILLIGDHLHCSESGKRRLGGRENLAACPKLPSKQVIGVFAQVIQRDTGSLSHTGMPVRGTRGVQAQGPRPQLTEASLPTYKDLSSLHVIRR